MQQWKSCKEVAKEAVLLFRMGDFYEAFFEDAEIIAKELDLTLTKRGGIPMAGVPWHTCESYIDRLVNKGKRVAIAEQTEDPKLAKGLVKREIVRFITPGTVVNLTSQGNNFIAAVAQVGSLFGLAFLDLTTSLFQVIEVEDRREIQAELYRLSPAEILTTPTFRAKHADLVEDLNGVIFSTATWQFEHKAAYNYLIDHFKVPHLDHFGLKTQVAAINAAGALLSYIHEELSLPIHHIRQIKPLACEEILSIDRVTGRNLELTEPLHKGPRSTTLLQVIDKTQTPMGSRLMGGWLKRPLQKKAPIEKRLESVEMLYFQAEVLAKLRAELKDVRDLERLMVRLSTGYGTPRDLLALAHSLQPVASLKKTVGKLEAPLLQECEKELQDHTELVETIQGALVDEPPLRLSDGGIFREGVSAELDELRAITRGGKSWLANYQSKLKEETGIRNLRVNFNKVFGYYIEVSQGQAHLMPESFQRRQTLVNSERFISPELKEYETKVLSAEDRTHQLEQTLFQELRSRVLEHEKEVIATAGAVATLDVLAALALVAKKERYCRPTLDEGSSLTIERGRHPVVDSLDPDRFIANDTLLDQRERLMVITGPNMAGKSTYIRQVALLVILAQMGSFVPADRAHIGLVDKIFTRIGASDDLSSGQSTFMVEMSETAHILNNATARSLVILDEIGRGTSTYDGVAIAWSVAEYLVQMQTKTLFATHYWELTDLETQFEGAVNYHAAVQEHREEIRFLHQIKRGGGGKSYGIHVAKLAGLPLTVISRAQAILKKLEPSKEKRFRVQATAREEQLTLF